MGLLDGIAGQVLGSLANGSAGAGSASASQGGLLQIIGHLLDNPQTGGLAGLVQAFQQNGLGEIVASWVGTGRNLPVNADQLRSVLGEGRLDTIAAQVGMNPDDALGGLAQLLPQVIDRLTPGGTLPDAAAPGGLQGLLGLLGGR